MSVSWLKKGEESVAIAKQEAVDQEIRKSEQGKMFRYFLKQGEEGRATFVDGELNGDGLLVPPRFYEHNLFLNGSWGNLFVCPEKTAPHLGMKCPICSGGDKPALIALFTVIDHREVKSKDGTKTYKDMPRLFAAKSGTMEILAKIASKRGGLAGVTFDISRSKADKSPSVGDMFDFVEKSPVEALVQKYMREFKDPKTNKVEMKSLFVPADYEKELTFRSDVELAAMGFGAPQVSGYSAAPAQASENSTNYDDQL
jgi:hypothetical protein